MAFRFLLFRSRMVRDLHRPGEQQNQQPPKRDMEKLDCSIQSVRDREVRFQIGDVYYPDAASILKELHSDDVLRGRVIDLSEAGERGETFVVVQVNGLAQPVVVPLRCIQDAIGPFTQ